MSKYVQFGFGTHHVGSFRYVADSGITHEEWAEMSEKEQEDAVTEWLFEQCEAWVEEDES